MRTRMTTVLTTVILALGFVWAASGCASTGSAPTPTHQTLQAKRPGYAPRNNPAPRVTIPDSCKPQPTSAVTATVVTPRTDGIFVGASSGSTIGIRFLPDHTLLYVAAIPGTPAQLLMTKLTLQNVTANRGDWQHVSYDSIGDFTLTVFGGHNHFTVRDYTGTGFTLNNQNDFGCQPGQVNLSNLTMSFFK